MDQIGDNTAERKIIHCDCDCFYAAVEQRDDPSLRGKPIAVGGAGDRRGVLCTASYEARAYGVRSAMPTRTALKLCPDLIVLPVAMDKYKAVAKDVRGVFQRYTDVIEPLSLDEAYLDVSGSEHHQGSATLIAEAIRSEVRDSLGITISAGVAPNKFLAKVASDWHKPDGIKVIPPQEVEAFVAALPVDKIHGVGKITAKKLHDLGIFRCADLRRWELVDLSKHFGSFAQALHNYAQGIDRREVKPSRSRKSLSVELTFAEDLPNADACLAKLPDLLARLNRRLEQLPHTPAVAGQFVKLKSADFRSTTVDRQQLGDWEEGAFGPMLEEAWQRFASPVRLLGIGLRFRVLLPDSQQLPLPFVPGSGSPL